jgi:hypothetical protein
VTQRNPLPYCLAHLSQADPAWRRYVPGEMIENGRWVAARSGRGMCITLARYLNPGDLFCYLPPPDRIVK